MPCERGGKIYRCERLTFRRNRAREKETTNLMIAAEQRDRSAQRAKGLGESGRSITSIIKSRCVAGSSLSLWSELAPFTACLSIILVAPFISSVFRLSGMAARTGSSTYHSASSSVRNEPSTASMPITVATPSARPRTRERPSTNVFLGLTGESATSGSSIIRNTGLSTPACNTRFLRRRVMDWKRSRSDSTSRWRTLYGIAILFSSSAFCSCSCSERSSLRSASSAAW